MKGDINAGDKCLGVIGIVVTIETVGINEFIQGKIRERILGSKPMHCEIPPPTGLRKKNEPIKETNQDNRAIELKEDRMLCSKSKGEKIFK